MPTSVEDLQRIVADHDNYPSPVRAVGSLHSLNASFVTEGTLVLMEKFKHIDVHIDGTVTVGAGVTMLELRDALRAHGAQIERPQRRIALAGEDQRQRDRAVEQVGAAVLAGPLGRS